MTEKERIARIERAVGQLGVALQRAYGSRLWRGAPDLLALTELHLGEAFDPTAPGVGTGAVG